MEGNHLPNLSGLSLVEAGADIGAKSDDPAQSPMWPGQAEQNKWTKAFVNGVADTLRQGERGVFLADMTKQHLIVFFNGKYNFSDSKLMSELWSSVAFFYRGIQNHETFKPWADTITYKFKEEPYTKSDKFPTRADVIKLFQDFFIEDRNLDAAFEREKFNLRAFCEDIGFWPGGNAHADLFLKVYNAKMDELVSKNKLTLDMSNEYKEKIKLVHRQLGFFNALDPAANKRKWVVQVLKEEEAYLSKVKPLQAARLRAKGKAEAEGWGKRAAELRQQVAEQKEARQAAAEAMARHLQRLKELYPEAAQEQAAHALAKFAKAEEEAKEADKALEKEAEEAMEVAEEAMAKAERLATSQELELKQFKEERPETTKTILEAMKIVNDNRIPYKLEKL